MSHQTFDDQLNDLLDNYEKGQTGKRDHREAALNEEAQFIATFVEVRANDSRNEPKAERRGGKCAIRHSRSRDKDFAVFGKAVRR